MIFIFFLRISSFYQASYHNHWLSCSGVNYWVWIFILLFSPPGALYNMNHTKDAQLASFWDFHSGVMIQQIAWRHHHHYHHLKYAGGCTTQDRCTSVTGPTSKAKSYSLVWSRWTLMCFFFIFAIFYETPSDKYRYSLVWSRWTPCSLCFLSRNNWNKAR